MRISKAEQAAIKTVVSLGKKWGYGNLIDHLQSAWTKHLMDNYGFDEKSARRGQVCYPVKMHLDIVENGQWDETGEAYMEEI